MCFEGQNLKTKIEERLNHSRKQKYTRVYQDGSLTIILKSTREKGEQRKTDRCGFNLQKSDFHHELSKYLYNMDNTVKSN